MVKLVDLDYILQYHYVYYKDKWFEFPLGNFVSHEDILIMLRNGKEPKVSDKGKPVNIKMDREGKIYKKDGIFWKACNWG